MGSLTMRSRRAEIRYATSMEMNSTRIAILAYSQSRALDPLRSDTMAIEPVLSPFR